LSTTEVESFLARHPQLRHVDVLLADLNGVERGKRIDREQLLTLYERGLLMPGSMFALDVQGATAQTTGLGFDQGDADRPCLPLPDTLVPVPWQQGELAQLQVSMHERDGRPFYADPRHALVKVLDRFHRLNLTPVVALEFEFYFVDRERTDRGLPQPPPLPRAGRRQFRTQINSMTDLDEYSAVLSRLDEVCRLQDIPTTSALAEYGPAQFEMNLAHRADALRACDEAVRFKRAVRAVAREFGWDATFLPKPYGTMAGSGLHVHVSLQDAGGQNIFACDPVDASTVSRAELRHAIGGLLDTLADGVAICAPGPNSYRRFQPESYVPMIPSWSINHRGAAIRIPESDAANRRIEHRLAGADANPYLVLAWVLAGIHHGIANGLEPPPAATGRGDAGGDALPTHWDSALARFAGSSFAANYLGKPFCTHYRAVKEFELEQFRAEVTPAEIAWYMGAV
jgi:glutamine synthetase